MQLMLSFEQVSYCYPGASELALDSVSFEVLPGEYAVLLGSNGSGKSTLAQLSNGLLLPTQGKVLVHGLSTGDRATIRKLRSQLGVVAQNPDNQIVSTTVLDEVAFGLENLGTERTVMAAKVARALEALGLDGFEERDPNSLSGGEKQRLIVAGLIAMEPGFLVLDEPMSMLDGDGQAEVRAVISRLHADGHGILHITHDLRFARDAERALVLADGRLVFDGKPGVLLDDEDRLVELELMVRESDMSNPKTASSLRAQRSNPEAKAATLPLDCHVALRACPGAFASSRPFSLAARHWRPARALESRNDGETVKCNSKLAFIRSSNTEMPSLSLENIHYSYLTGTENERIVLCGLDLAITPGSYTLISGKTGSGKSTLLRILAGLLEPTAGRAGFSNGAKVLPGDVGIVFQHPESQLFAKTIEEEILFGPVNLRLLHTREERICAVEDALRAVGLDPASFASRSPYTLSGGEMRRVAIASILSMRQGYLLLDEPTASLDARGRAFVHRLIRRLAEAGVGVVVVSHDLDEFKPRAQRHLVLKDGRLWHS